MGLTDKIKEEIGYLSMRIDYPKLKDFEMENNTKSTKAGTKHIKNVLNYAEIYSPLDLLKEISFQIKYAKETRWDSFNTKNLDGKELYANFFSRYRQFGEKSIGLILDYLESQGFDFSKEYAEKIDEYLTEED